jgi:hypothetical protein
LILNKAIFHHLPKEENPFYHIWIWLWVWCVVRTCSNKVFIIIESSSTLTRGLCGHINLFLKFFTVLSLSQAVLSRQKVYKKNCYLTFFHNISNIFHESTYLRKKNDLVMNESHILQWRCSET